MLWCVCGTYDKKQCYGMSVEQHMTRNQRYGMSVEHVMTEINVMVFVTLPPEMSRIATCSLFRYSHFARGGARY